MAILGVIFLYVYALLGFALFRTLFDPTQELYCATLWQCSVTLIRYGLIGDIDEVRFFLFLDLWLNETGMDSSSMLKYCLKIVKELHFKMQITKNNFNEVKK